MDHSLPDEIISEILSPALKVSDEIFCDNSDVSPFAKYSESTSAYLLVCKSWLRVATPLLYNIVILRSKAQAKALSLALSKNEQLGQFIKKLRVEGGYGSPMHIILQCSPNISDLFVSLEVYSSDNTSGLCKGLQLINPTRLIVRDLDYKHLDNKMVSQLMEALLRSMRKWDRLCAFDCPYTEGSSRASKVIQPLVESKRLHTLAIPSATGLSWAYSIFKGCPLKSIVIKRPVATWERSELPFEKDPVLMALLKFAESPGRGKARAQEPILEAVLITPSLNPFFVPMASASKEVQDKVWARVLYFAMSVPKLANNPASRDVSDRLPLLLVSNSFKRLGLPHYYAHVLLDGPLAIPKFASVLSRNPSIGPNVRSLDFKFSIDSSVGDAMLEILSRTTGLIRFGLHNGFTIDQIFARIVAFIPWNVFEAVAKSSGATLRECYARILEPERASATILDDLTALRTLSWDSLTAFDVDTANPDGLSDLEKLRIVSASQSFWTVLSEMNLGSLRHFMLSINDFSPALSLHSFLKAHGTKITEVELPLTKLRTLRVKLFELCPNLLSISLCGRASVDTSPTADDLYSPRAVPSLVKFILNVPYWTRRVPARYCQRELKLCRRDKTRLAQWELFFLKFDPKNLPNLHEIEAKCCAWPTNEWALFYNYFASWSLFLFSQTDIPKNCWVRWAEILLKRGINLTDKTGTKWRPRLQVK
ncbi:hypothetical protein B0H12DRAFT_1057149 [Mycena haematopus]|nr:hypothetical protein B0H12DRAFT_1057149 [Mycena haematopus]